MMYGMMKVENNRRQSKRETLTLSKNVFCVKLALKEKGEGRI